MPKKAKREIVSIEVDEIHLVDDPAVLEKFVQIKNQEGKKKKETEKEEEAKTEEKSEDKTEEKSEEKTEEKTENEKTEEEKDEGETKKDEHEKQEHLTPHHDGLLHEKLAILGECGKKIWEGASMMDAYDEEKMDELHSKIWDMSSLMWQICDHARTVSLAKSAEKQAKEGDISGVIDTVAKMMKVVGESTPVEKGEKRKMEFPYEGNSYTKMIDAEKLKKLMDGLALMTDAMSGINPEDLSSMLERLMVAEIEEEDSDHTETEMGSDKEKGVDGEGGEVEQLKADLEAQKEKCRELEKQYKKAQESVEPSNSLGVELSGKQKSKKENKVSWEDDLSSVVVKHADKTEEKVSWEDDLSSNFRR